MVVIKYAMGIMGFKAQTTIIKVIKNDMKIKSVSTISSTRIN